MIEPIDVLRFALLVVWTEAVTEILVAARVTDGLRAFIFRRAFPEVPEGQPHPKDPPVGPGFWRFANDVFTCGYCMSVWVAMGSAVFAPRWLPVEDWHGVFFNWLLMVFVLHRAGNYMHVVFSLVKKGRVKTHDVEILHKHRVEHDGSDGQIGGSESPPA